MRCASPASACGQGPQGQTNTIRYGHIRGLLGSPSARKAIFQAGSLKEIANDFCKSRATGWNAPVSLGNFRKTPNKHSGGCTDTLPQEEIKC